MTGRSRRLQGEGLGRVERNGVKGLEVFELRFPRERIAFWAARYAYPGDAPILTRLAPEVRRRGYLTRGEFLELCEWKTPRSRPRCAQNSAARVRDATGLALATGDERAKIGILRLLDGVEWPTASVILHFCDERPYPILDYRALWSLGHSRPPAYTFDFWLAYTTFARDLAAASGHSMRELDRALWQYSKENQPKSPQRSHGPPPRPPRRPRRGYASRSSAGSRQER